MSRHRKLSLFALVAALAIALYFLPQNPIRTSAGEVRELSVTVGPYGDDGQRREPILHSTEDSGIIEEVLKTVKAAREGPDHKCGHRGTIEFRQVNGQTFTIEFLPGHDPEFYEFRLNRKLYRMPREAFIRAMKKLGVELPMRC